MNPPPGTSILGAIPRKQRSDAFVAGYGCAAISAACAIAALVFFPVTREAFIVPATLAGALVGIDWFRALRREIDVFSPRALASAILYHLVFLGPVLHFVLDYWPLRVRPPESWSDAFLALSVVNLIAGAIYALIVQRPDARGQATVPQARRDQTVTAQLLALGGSVSFAAWLYLSTRFGGPLEYIRTIAQERVSLEGQGDLLLVAEAFPVLFAAAFVVRFRHRLAVDVVLLSTAMFVFTAVAFLSAGLRGSRANTVWPVLTMLLLVHLMVRPIRKRVIILVAVVLLSFSSVYDLYKKGGVEAGALILNGDISAAQQIAETRGVADLILGDLGRADVQALVLDRIRNEGVEAANGASYMGDIAVLLPNSWLDGPVRSKTYYGTRLQYGWSAPSTGFASSRIYGLNGEAIMNLGPVGSPIALGAFAFVIRGLQRLYRAASFSGSAPISIMAALLVPLAVLIALSDMDNVAVYLARRVLPVAILLWLAVRSAKSRVA